MGKHHRGSTSPKKSAQPRKEDDSREERMISLSDLPALELIEGYRRRDDAYLFERRRVEPTPRAAPKKSQMGVWANSVKIWLSGFRDMVNKNSGMPPLTQKFWAYITTIIFLCVFGVYTKLRDQVEEKHFEDYPSYGALMTALMLVGSTFFGLLMAKLGVF